MVEREKKKIAKRLENHLENDVFERRTTPPEDWNKPLPPDLKELNENSILQQYQENGGSLPLEAYQHQFSKCVVM